MLGLPSQLRTLENLMNVADLRHHVISQNIANVNTPGYQRLSVEFEQQLAEQLMSPSGQAATNVQPRVVKEEGLPMRADGNNVDVDREIGELNQNALLYQTYSQILSSQFDLLRRATRGA